MSREKLKSVQADRMDLPAPSEPVSDQTPSLKTAGGSNIDRFNIAILDEVMNSLFLHSGLPSEKIAGLRTAAIRAMMAFKPADEIEGMIAAQAVAMHFGSMECFRRAMLPEQLVDVAARLRKDGASLARGMTDMLAALDRKRGKGSQVVRVERVTIEPGAQAIVGNIGRTLG